MPTRAGRHHPIDARPATILAAGQIGFFAFGAVCVALHPGFVLKADEGGFSNYGAHLATAVPYALAFVSAAGGSLLAAHRYRGGDRPARRLGGLLAVDGLLLLLTLASSFVYQLTGGLTRLHDVVGGVTILFELGASVWLAGGRRDLVTGGALVVQVVGVALVLVTATGGLHLLFVGQVLAAAGFAVLVVGRARRTPVVTSSRARVTR